MSMGFNNVAQRNYRRITLFVKKTELRRPFIYKTPDQFFTPCVLERDIHPEITPSPVQQWEIPFIVRKFVVSHIVHNELIDIPYRVNRVGSRSAIFVGIPSFGKVNQISNYAFVQLPLAVTFFQIVDLYHCSCPLHYHFRCPLLSVVFPFELS